MFKTFRHRLLFWFSVFISFSLVIAVLAVLYLETREKIVQRTEAIEQSYVMLLKSVKNQQDFFSYDTKKEIFCQTNMSVYLDRYEEYRDSTISLLETAQDSRMEIELSKPETLIPEVQQIDSLFMLLINAAVERGFKDCNLEGEMREDAHWLENITEIPRADILTLRRHEKDYIIRNEDKYVRQLSNLVSGIKTRLSKQNNILAARKDTIIFHLERYHEKFIQIVALDQLIGIRDNTGLKKQIDYRLATLEIRLASAVQQAHMWADEEYKRLTLIYSTIAIILVLGGLVLSAIIANRVTAPLTDLTEHINKFVESDFELKEVYPRAKARDEIGTLTNNFLDMKKEVKSTVTDFKEKVAARTQELADAYDKMSKLNEANSRFVPREFLQNLGKDSIEEVSLGDQVEREMTVVFTDIRDFTTFSEGLTPQENFDFLNEYYNGIVPIIKNNGGFIDKFIGDSVMALFPKGADQALKSVYGFEDFLAKLNKKRAKKDKLPIEIGTGIHTGKVILGTIGHRRRLETTVISDAVNTASRIEGLTKYYGAKIVGTAAMLEILKKKKVYKHRFLDMVQVKGRSRTTAIYEFLTPKDVAKLACLEEYNIAIELVAQKEIAAAAERFSSLYQNNPNDLAVAIMLEKCRDYLENNKDTWQEVTQMFAK